MSWLRFKLVLSLVLCGISSYAFSTDTQDLISMKKTPHRRVKSFARKAYKPPEGTPSEPLVAKSFCPITPAYAYVFSNTNFTPLPDNTTIPFDATPYKITANMAYTASTGTIQVLEAGTYAIDYYLLATQSGPASFASGAIDVVINGLRIAPFSRFYLGVNTSGLPTSTFVVSSEGPLIIQLAANDTIAICPHSSIGLGTTFDLNSSNFPRSLSVTRIE